MIAEIRETLKPVCRVCLSLGANRIREYHMSNFPRYSLLFVGQAKSMAKVKVETIARMMMARQYVETASDPKLAFSSPRQPA